MGLKNKILATYKLHKSFCFFFAMEVWHATYNNHKEGNCADKCMETVNVDAINRKISKLDKKLDSVVEYLDDITMTPEEYSEYIAAEKAHSKGEHKNWKTAEELLKEEN
ncbi:hypothetical protein JW721_06120 [Candidatus Micrarchaeota archaeon]|nr:hypothetical protein [Candidatus Micrarchaeota archaeon]